MPAVYYLLQRPGFSLCRIDMQYQMVVVAHDCISTDIQRKCLGQSQQPIFDPLLPEFEVTPGALILAA